MNARLQMLAGSFASIPLTLFGLILVTFLIGRVMPIDPVIAIAGDHAPKIWSGALTACALAIAVDGALALVERRLVRTRRG